MASDQEKHLPKQKKPVGGNFSGTNLALAGGHNLRVTLQAIRVNSPITRIDLADMTGLTAPAIANITKKLLADGLIAEVGRVRGGRGQPAKMLAINPDGCYSLGVNIDRDHITFVALDLQGNVRARATREIDFALPAVVAEHFRDETDYFFGEAGVPRDKVIGVGVALPDDMGKVALPLQPPEYAVWTDTDVEALFNNIIDLPTYVENDATAAAIGEMHFGRGLQFPTFLYILVTWGLGGGLVIDGVYFRGATGRSGEIGFLPVLEGAGQGGSLQDVVSLSALYQYLSARGFDLSTPKDIEDLQPDITPALHEWAKTAAQHLIDPIINVNCLLNPDAVLIGGRLPLKAADEIAALINRELAHNNAGIPAVCPVERAGIAEDAPAVGAAILPFSDMLFPTRSALFKTAG